MTTRVLVVDDHSVVRAGLRSLLGIVDGLEVVAEAGSAEEAYTAVSQHGPDVVVMDVGLGHGADGIDATRRICERHPGTAVLVLSMLRDDALVLRALRAGARGYLLKDSAPAEVVRAVQSVAAGQAVFDALLAPRLQDLLDSERLQRKTFPQLTDREREVLALVAAGRSNEMIAARLDLSPKTVRNNVSAILTKLQVRDRAAAIVLAREAGLGTGRR